MQYIQSNKLIYIMQDLQLNGFFDNTINTICECIRHRDNYNFIFFRDAMRYCFGPITEKELTILVTEWNYHRIRKTPNAEAPGGIPEVLYYLPDTTGILYIIIKLYIILYIKTVYVYTHSDCAGAHDYTCSLQSDLLGDAKYLYGYIIMVET